MSQRQSTTEGQSSSGSRKAIPATCALHRGTAGFTNLMVKTSDRMIVLDPHVDGCCVITLNEVAACALYDVLTEGLQQTGRLTSQGLAASHDHGSG
ncbi:MAG: hypothetical protein M3300_03655 [Actinomycetota bacterium]|nr:hypothetical protein [Actinomycetota bacterium]